MGCTHAMARLCRLATRCRAGRARTRLREFAEARHRYSSVFHPDAPSASVCLMPHGRVRRRHPAELHRVAGRARIQFAELRETLSRHHRTRRRVACRRASDRPMTASYQPTRAARRRLPIGALAIPGFAMALMAFLVFALPIYSTTHRLLAWCVLVLTTVPLIRYLCRPVGVPLLEFVALQYGVMFALPVFYEEKLVGYRFTGAPSSEAITTTLTCCILAVVAMQAGFCIAAAKIRITPRLLSFQSSPRRLFVFAVATVIGSLLVETRAIVVGVNVHQAVNVILSSDLGIALLGLLH